MKIILFICFCTVLSCVHVELSESDKAQVIANYTREISNVYSQLPRPSSNEAAEFIKDVLTDIKMNHAIKSSRSQIVNNVKMLVEKALMLNPEEQYLLNNMDSFESGKLSFISDLSFALTAVENLYWNEWACTFMPDNLNVYVLLDTLYLKSNASYTIPIGSIGSPFQPVIKNSLQDTLPNLIKIRTDSARAELEKFPLEYTLQNVITGSERTFLDTLYVKTF